MPASTAIIFGSGGLPGFADLPATQAGLETPYGSAAAPVRRRAGAQGTVLALARHGETHPLAPHAINYRANLWLLKELGATRALAIYTVGAIDGALRPGGLVLPEQIVDYSWGRAQAFSDSADGHFDFTHPFDAQLHRALGDEAERLGIPLALGGVYGCTQGPRLETAAEIDRMERDGCTLVGMTAMPEAALARQLDLPLAAICVVVNAAAGRGGQGGGIDLRSLGRSREAGLNAAGRLAAAFCGLEGG